MESIRIGGLYDGDTKHQAGSVWDKNKLAPTIDTMQGGYREPMIIEEIKKYGNKNGNYVPYDGAACYPLHSQDFIRTGFQDISYTLSARDYKDPKCVIVKGGTETMSEVKDNLVMERKCISTKGKENDVASTILSGYERSNMTGFNADNGVSENVNTQYRIRKLTPRECGRLMDVDDEDIDKMLAVNSNSQAYKQYGNSIVKRCLIAVFSQMGIQGIPRWNEGLSEKYK